MHHRDTEPRSHGAMTEEQILRRYLNDAKFRGFVDVLDGVVDAKLFSLKDLELAVSVVAHKQQGKFRPPRPPAASFDPQPPATNP